ncbi:hypothetical protein DM860_001261 [Cuscuta australis]|uniref:DUF4378 domain-containing protein n=1 Tax=Cuscuta australis TaxID=267555 RepID=A0A328DXM0_9ASTE|nr:hypothetical protein DM860_001261 [Cuscuta australis]
MMENKPQTHPFRYKKDQASCIRGFANVFDFRHGWSTRNLLADRREGRRQAAGSSSRMKLAVPNPSEKSIYVEDDDESEAKTMEFKKSVKELMEEDMLGEPRLKNQRNDIELELGTYNSNNTHKGRSIAKRNRGRTYGRSRSMSLSGLDDLQIKSSSFRKDDLQIKSSRFRMKDVDSDYNEEDRARQALEEKVSASIEKFVSQNLNDARHFSQYGATSDSKDLMDALKALSSNKELCWKLLGDPNSRLVKRIENLEDEDVEEEGKTNSRLESNLMQKSSVLEKKHETIKTKQAHFFCRRSKSQESYPLPQHEKSQISRKIVILKPAPASLESHVSHYSHTKLQSAKTSLHFSFTEIKNRLKKAMGKEKQETSRDLSMHKKHSNTDRGISGENSGWSSPNRNHFYIERFAKPPFGFVGVDKKGKAKDIEKDAFDHPKLRVSKSSFEAKDDLLEMLDDMEKEEKSFSDGLPVYQERDHSYLDYNISLNCSPRKCSDEQILPPRKRLIHSDSYQTDIGVMHKLEQKDRSDHSSNMEDQSFAAGINAKQDIELANARIDVPCNIPLDILLEKAIPLTNYKVLESDRKESGSTGSLEDEKPVVASCEPSSFPVIKESGHADVTEAFNEETSFQSSDFSSECLRDFPTQQEIISCWSDPPRHSTVEHKIQPQKIHFQEPAASCSLDQQQLHTLDFPENEESAAFEYVEALLLGSGLNWDEYLSTWLSSDQILDPSLCDEIELLSDPSLRKFLFDCANKVLSKMCGRYFGCFTGMPLVKNNVRPVPKGMDLIQEVWEGVEWHHLSNQSPSYSLEQLVEKDIAMPGTWMDLRSYLEDIGIGLEEAIIDGLVDETLLILANGTSEGVLISPGRERNRDGDVNIPTFPNFI